MNENGAALDSPEHVVSTVSQLRSLYGAIPKRAAGKVHHEVDEHDAAFIARSPFLVLATASADGLLDVSPRGDLPGFVQVLGPSRLLLPDRPGNNRIDSLLNLMGDSRLSLIFFLPGVGQTLRVNGRGRVSIAPGLLRAAAMNGREPATVLLVDVVEVLYQCPRALVRSRLWDPAAHVPAEEAPSLDDVLAAQVPDLSLEESRAIGRASRDDPLW